MFEYKFERIPLKYKKLGIQDSEPVEDYQEVIHQHAKEGWRLVQIFAPSVQSTGMASYFELIFEREKAE
ncbi:DUF4177 domain-containing protein [Paenibacillus senegalensis]|uniref:DUF4177 domain-containing protein n=1 Tax=Paenibacillus senegalensis TaxID=1465766 RepID=UPI00028833D5|nr:DUF4177 domain-containing protein [Paenibacillus senegalensis]